MTCVAFRLDGDRFLIVRNNANAARYGLTWFPALAAKEFIRPALVLFGCPFRLQPGLQNGTENKRRPPLIQGWETVAEPPANGGVSTIQGFRNLRQRIGLGWADSPEVRLSLLRFSHGALQPCLAAYSDVE